jgi:CBS domain containing-hemolysin-like protein
LEKEEVDIVTGALAYKEKTVRSVMTPLNDAYQLNIKTVLDFDTISEIREQVTTLFFEQRNLIRLVGHYLINFVRLP